jgi:hypothetical protein
MALRIDIEVDLTVRKVVEALLSSSLGNPSGLPMIGDVTHANAGIVI